MVNNKTLLLIACLVWTAAGFNILRIGIIEYPPYLSAVNFLLSAVVFAVFQFLIFGRLVKKHTKRIDAYGDQKQLFIKGISKNRFEKGKSTECVGYKESRRSKAVCLARRLDAVDGVL